MVGNIRIWSGGGYMDMEWWGIYGYGVVGDIRIWSGGEYTDMEWWGIYGYGVVGDMWIWSGGEYVSVVATIFKKYTDNNNKSI